MKFFLTLITLTLFPLVSPAYILTAEQRSTRIKERFLEVKIQMIRNNPGWSGKDFYMVIKSQGFMKRVTENPRSLMVDGIEVGGRDIVNIAPLLSLSVKVIILRKTSVNSLKRLQKSSIRELYLIDNPKITNLEPLRNMPELKGLALRGEKVKDLTPLKNTKVDKLELKDVGVINISLLQAIPLKTLFLSGTNLTGFNILPKLQTLTTLGLDNVKINNLDMLTSLKNLKKVYLNDLPVKSVAPLSKLKLDELSVTNCKFQNSVQLKNMHLQELSLMRTKVSSIASLQGMPLKVLGLRDTEVKDITPLQGMPLEILMLGNTHITNLKALGGMKTLKILDISGTKITSLRPLRGLKLTRIELRNTPVKDIRALKGMPLKHVDLLGSKVADIGALQGMKLDFLDIRNTPAFSQPLPPKLEVDHFYRKGKRDYWPWIPRLMKKLWHKKGIFYDNETNPSDRLWPWNPYKEDPQRLEEGV
ncbi:MAG: leucine-rich repeat domain-containing protein [Lentisphaerae bacterium]|nr:leucine-rich repeat domain-containing protein [Lentisphaerota bacterium]MCP4101764.1 leucine-rich repeat domain-containing protein [Lentisphaerota bacterium]